MIQSAREICASVTESSTPEQQDLFLGEIKSKKKIVESLKAVVRELFSNAITQSSATAVTSIVMNDSRNAVEVRNTIKDQEHRISLTSLPAWCTVRTAAVAIQLPVDERDIIKIILNKSAKPFYSFPTPPDTYLSIIIYRDSSALSCIV